MHRSTVFGVLYWAWVASEVVVLIGTRTRRSSGQVQDRGSLLILWPVIFASVSTAMWLGDSSSPTILGGAHWVRTCSVVLLAAGLAIRWSAIVMLGKSFSANVAIHATQTLRTSGLFHFVRHPSYSGMLLIFTAIGLYTLHWSSLAIMLIPTTAALLYRIHVEETALRHAFGDEYEQYSEATKRLIPGVY